MLYNKFDRPNVTWKVRVCSTPRSFATNGITSSGTFTKSTFYRQVTGNCLLDDVEDGMFRTHKSLTFKNPQIQTMVNPEGNDLECITTRQFYIKAAAKIKYAVNSNSYPSSGRDDFLVVDAYDAYGTVSTANIGGFQAFACMYYKDP